LPIGSIAFRVGLASAVVGALAAAQVARLGQLVAGSVHAACNAEARTELPGALAGLLFGFSYAAAFQSVRPEVYALSALLTVSAAVRLYQFASRGDLRHLALAALWTGLALSNHTLTALGFAIPSAIYALSVAQARTRRAILLALVAALLGAVVLVYLPLRAARHPFIDWGAPESWSRFWWVFSAKAFQKAVGERGSTGELGDLLVALAAQVQFIGVFLALLGAYILFRLRMLRARAAWLVTLLGFNLATPLLVGFDVHNPDAYGYLEVSVAVLAMLAVVPIALLQTKVRVQRAAAIALASIAAVGLWTVSFSRNSLAHFGEASRIIRDFADRTPPRATLVTSYVHTIFMLDYLRIAEGYRPDLNLVHRHFLAYPGYRDEIVRRTPELAPMLGERDVVPSQVAEARFEYDLDLPAPLVPSAVLPRLQLTSSDVQTRRFMAWQSFLATHRACKLGDHESFAKELAEARKQLGASPELDELERRCR
jgi:hypothetical protein